MEGSLTIKSLLAVRDKLKAIPPPPFLASSRNFPADNPIKFECDGRTYLGAHPDFWAKIPKREFDQSGVVNPWNGTAVHNLDLHKGMAVVFLSAMAEAIGS